MPPIKEDRVNNYPSGFRWEMATPQQPEWHCLIAPSGVCAAKVSLQTNTKVTLRANAINRHDWISYDQLGHESDKGHASSVSHAMIMAESAVLRSGNHFVAYQSVRAAQAKEDFSALKYGNMTVARIVDSEGLGYAVEDFMNADAIADPEVARRWQAAQDALGALRELLPPVDEDDEDFL
jgi:hypothetical protein